jgi:hypothetical protein
MGSFKLLEDVFVKLCRDVWILLDHESGLESTVCKALNLEPQIFDKILYKNEIFSLNYTDKIVLCLDEKWFYPFSRRKNYKILPRQDGEAEDEDKVHYRTVVSRRNVSKVMYMGVVGKPVPEKGYDGKVFLKRIS